MLVQIANSNPLVSDRQDLTVLQKEYAEDDTVYQLKIKVSHTTPPIRLLQPLHTSSRVQDVIFFHS